MSEAGRRLVSGRRLLKRWTYVGVYGRACMLCAGVVRVAGVPQTFWAVWDRSERRLTERTVLLRVAATVGPAAVRVEQGGVRIRLELQPVGPPVEVTSDHAGRPIWTRKTPIEARGTVWVGAHRIDVASAGIVDESAGYHARRTQWDWSAGAGTSDDGRRVVWNAVAGVHDSDPVSERAVWIDGKIVGMAPATFSSSLDEVTFAGGERLRFRAEALRQRSDNLVVIRSDYVQPFGTFSGSLPGGVVLADGWGVMERHRAVW